ncbi:MAG: guanylate kinase [Chloroflexi bacterium]|nr:guanylate kinase [Chloroflexota bacterium]
MADSRDRRHPHPVLLVLSGPSGVGKDTLLRRSRELGIAFHYAVTATTRPPRPGEEHGVHHFFLSKEEFLRWRDEGRLLEWAEVYGHLYGVPREPVREALKQGKDVIVRTDIQGAITIRSKVPEAVLVFLAPPSLEELAERLRRRETESKTQLARRLDEASREMAAADSFDYLVDSPTDRIEQAVKAVQAILEAEHHRLRRRELAL